MADVFAISILKHGELYILVFDAGEQCAAFRQIGRWASNAELSFTWTDAADMANSVHQTIERKH